MENGEWRMTNGEWRMANGEWRMENGERRKRLWCGLSMVFPGNDDPGRGSQGSPVTPMAHVPCPHRFGRNLPCRVSRDLTVTLYNTRSYTVRERSGYWGGGAAMLGTRLWRVCTYCTNGILNMPQ
ncbi:hypothetical protein F4803DRAFT_216187 [Xylaria telfairii]|nr:hypothetical protein F4803DRAFT_216187 [Xylaria telfairii]